MEPIIISYCYCSFLSTLVGQGVQKYNRPQSLLIATCYWLIQADIICICSIEATTTHWWLIISCINISKQNIQLQCNLQNKLIGQSIYTNQIAYYQYILDFHIYHYQYLADIRYQCSAMQGCRDRLGPHPGRSRVGSGTVSGGGGTVPGGGGGGMVWRYWLVQWQ